MEPFSNGRLILQDLLNVYSKETYAPVCRLNYCKHVEQFKLE